jgi:hypothetical protein
MSIKVDLSAPEVDAQISLLNQYPEIAERHYRPTLVRDVALLKQMIEPNIPVASGLAKRTFGSRVVGKGSRIMGEVGWYRKGSPFYVRFLEGGAKTHSISPRGSQRTIVRQLAGTGGSNVLRFWKGGSAVFVRRSVQHPGMRGRGFMAAAWAKAQTTVVADIAQANEAVVRELSIG